MCEYFVREDLLVLLRQRKWAKLWVDEFINLDQKQQMNQYAVHIT
jgi:hypothetical protein